MYIHEMCQPMKKRKVLPIANAYANQTRHFTLIQTFDHRADQRKRCTEVTGASIPGSLLQYNGIQIDQLEQVKCYKTKWLEGDFGHLKIITQYALFCKTLEYLKAIDLAHNFTHLVIGGNCGIFAAYSVEDFGNISPSLHDNS